MYLLLGAFIPFTFKLIINIYCHLVNYFGFLFVDLFSSSFDVFVCDLMAVFSVIFGLLSLVCLYLLFFWFTFLMKF